MSIFTDDQLYDAPGTSGDDRFHVLLRQAPKSLCVYPATHLNFKNDGGMSCCYRAKTLGNMNSSSIEDFWNSDKMKTIRTNMVQGIQSPECKGCWDMEKSGGFSYRQESLRDLAIHSYWRGQFDKMQPDGSMPFEVKQAELRFSNTCNLQCRMCSPVYSTKWETDMNKQSEVWQWLQKNNYYEDMQERMKENVSGEKMLEFIKKAAPHLEYLMITGGEPFIDTSHIEALEILKPYAKNIRLEYTTNLNTLTKSGFNVLDYWEDFKQIRLKVSIDGDPENYNYVRYGGDIQAVIDNARKIYERYPVENKNPNRVFPQEKVVIIGTCTVSAYNIGRLDHIAKFITSIGAIFHASQVVYPPFQASTMMPAEAKAAITRRLNHFLVDIDELEWGDHPIWKLDESRWLQKTRIFRHVKNSILAMNGQHTEEKYFRKFIEFERAFNRSKNIPDAHFEKFLADSYMKDAAARL